MVYATLLVGEEYCEAYSEQVNKEASKGTIHVLTDHPEYFPNGIIHHYNKKRFSYYDKLNFLVELVIKHQQRVTFVDADWCKNLDFIKVLDTPYVYCWRLFDMDDLHLIGIYQNGIDYCYKVLEELNLGDNDDKYPGEAILSMPPVSSIQGVKTKLKFIQPYWEKAFHSNITMNKKLERYASYGVGYCEGAALKAILGSFGIEVKELSRENFQKNTLL